MSVWKYLPGDLQKWSFADKEADIYSGIIQESGYF